jgi:hypothetical protein
MKWVPSLAESLNRAMLEELISWRVCETPDPLRWVLFLYLKRNWASPEVKLIREIIDLWARKNDAVYRRSQWKKNEFGALIIVKGLGPLKNINPFLE